MKDRALTKAACEYCHERHYLDELIRLEITDRSMDFDLFNEVVCERCKDYVIGYWWDVDPTHYRFYHPA